MKPFAIKKLDLSSVGLGGGWALGEQYAMLAPEKDQAKPVMKLTNGETLPATPRSDSSEEPTVQPQQVPQVPKLALGRSSESTPPPLPHSQSVVPDSPRWLPGSIASSHSIAQIVRCIAIYNEYAFVGFAEGPVQTMCIRGCELCPDVSTALGSSNVRAMCIVRSPASTTHSNVKLPLRVAQAHAANPRKEPLHAQKGTDYLWVGFENGRIVIYSIQKYSSGKLSLLEQGTITAHTDRITTLYATPNGRVWSAGRDSFIRVWEGSNGKSVARVTVRKPIKEFCFVDNGTIWTCSMESHIRVWSQDGQEVRITRMSSTSNFIYMQGLVHTMKYTAITQRMLVCEEGALRCVNVKSYDTADHINMVCRVMEICGNRAVVVGHTSEENIDRVYALDVTTLAIIFKGDPIEGVSIVGIRQITEQFFIVPHFRNGTADDRCISVVTTVEMHPVVTQTKSLSFKQPHHGGKPDFDIAGMRNSALQKETLEEIDASRAEESSSLAASVVEYKEDTEHSVVEAPSEERPDDGPPQAAATMPPTPHVTNAPVLDNERATRIEMKLDTVLRSVSVIQRAQEGICSDFGVLYGAMQEIRARNLQDAPALDAPALQWVDSFVTSEGKTMAHTLATLRQQLGVSRSRGSSTTQVGDIPNVNNSELASFWPCFQHAHRDIMRACEAVRTQASDKMAALHAQYHSAVQQNMAAIVGVNRVQTLMEQYANECGVPLAQSQSLRHDSTPSQISDSFDHLGSLIQSIRAANSSLRVAHHLSPSAILQAPSPMRASTTASPPQATYASEVPRPSEADVAHQLSSMAARINRWVASSTTKFESGTVSLDVCSPRSLETFRLRVQMTGLLQELCKNETLVVEGKRLIGNSNTSESATVFLAAVRALEQFGRECRSVLCGAKSPLHMEDPPSDIERRTEFFWHHQWYKSVSEGLEFIAEKGTLDNASRSCVETWGSQINSMKQRATEAKFERPETTDPNEQLHDDIAGLQMKADQLTTCCEAVMSGTGRPVPFPSPRQGNADSTLENGGAMRVVAPTKLFCSKIPSYDREPHV